TDGDREAGRIARQARLRGGDRDRADGLTGGAEARDPAGGGRGGEAGGGAAAGGLGERDDGRVVGGLEVAGRVTQLDGQRLRRAGGDAGVRAGVGEVVGGADGDREARRVRGEARLRGGDRDRADRLAGGVEARDPAGGG